MENTSISSEIKTTRREQWAWYLYDFGNSAYAAVVLLAVYSAYFKGTVVGGAEGSRLWGLSVGIAMLIVAITSPILGSIADFSATKKRFLLFFTSMAVLFTGSLFFIGEGDIVLGMLFFILAEIGYRSAQVFYNSILPDIAEPEEMGRISGYGWAIGSIGGIVCLLIVLALVMTFEGTMVVRFSFIITAIFFMLSALPIFFWLRNRGQSLDLPKNENQVSIAFKRLWKTFREIRKFRELLKFIIAFLIYNDGIMMTLDFAAIYGAVMYGLEQQQLIIFMIIVQVASVIGAYVFGILADKYSGKISLLISLVLMIAAILLLLLEPDLNGFYLIGSLAGFALTGVQSVSRMMVGKLSPKSRSAEFFGLFAVAGRSSSFIGPAVYGFLAAETALFFQSRGFEILQAEKVGQTYAMMSVCIFLIAGLIVLLFVNVKKGRAAAELENQIR
ncbi:MAG: MFS transporter [Anaerolineaceae bacterium]|nr:MFS transporter [Anaerolineaceae bacterium]